MNVQYVKDSEEVVPFLADDDLEDLIPLRIACHFGVILEVVSSEDIQGESSPLGPLGSSLSPEPRSISSNDHHGSDNRLLTAASSPSNTDSMTRDVATLGIAWTDDHQTRDMRLGGPFSETPTQELILRGDHSQTWARTSIDQQEQIHQLQQQLEEVRATIQQTQEKAQHYQQHAQDQIDKVLYSQQQLQQRIEGAVEIVQQSDQQRRQLDTVLQEVQQTNQQTQHSQQQMQQQVEELRQKLQKTDIELQHSQQLHEQLQQQVRDRDAIAKHQHPSPEMRHQEIVQVFDRLAHVQYRVQAALARTYRHLLIPRLFIVLPGPTGFVNGQENQGPMHFRLYFLCECGTHTMTEKCIDMHEVHLANHPGYEVVDSNSLFSKYGPYLLTMMDMVKYGVRTNGLLVPPLLGPSHRSNVDMDRDHFSFVQKNIGRLIDDTVAHIEEVSSTLDREDGIATQHSLSAQELAQITSYLDIKDAETYTGDLAPMTTQGRCTWICKEHWDTELAMRQLKNAIDTTRSTYTDKNIKVKTTSTTMANRFYDILVQMSKSKVSNTGFIDCLSNLESISVECGNVLISANSIAQGEVKDVAINVPRLGNLTIDEFELIRQCHPTLLKIRHAPQPEDEGYLVGIVQNTTELHIVYHEARAIDVVNLIVSTREKIPQSERRSSLQLLRVMNGELTSYDMSTLSGDQGLITVSFTEGSTKFDMESHVKLRLDLIDTDSIFIRKYGWSIKTLIAPESFGDSHAELLDMATLEHGSKLVAIRLTPTRLTLLGLESMDHVIKRAQSPPSMQLFLYSLGESHQLEKACLLLQRYKDRLVGLRLRGYSKMDWLLRISQAFPTRDKFPLLEELAIEGDTTFAPAVIFIPSPADKSLEWIVSMVSAPSQPLKRLKFFRLSKVHCEKFHAMMRAMDLSTLEVISIYDCVLSNQFIQLLAERAGDGGSQSKPLRRIDFSFCQIRPEDRSGVRTTFHEKAPHVEVVGL